MPYGALKLLPRIFTVRKVFRGGGNANALRGTETPKRINRLRLNFGVAETPMPYGALKR